MEESHLLLKFCYCFRNVIYLLYYYRTIYLYIFCNFLKNRSVSLNYLFIVFLVRQCVFLEIVAK